MTPEDKREFCERILGRERSARYFAKQGCDPGLKLICVLGDERMAQLRQALWWLLEGASFRRGIDEASFMASDLPVEFEGVTYLEGVGTLPESCVFAVYASAPSDQRCPPQEQSSGALETGPFSQARYPRI